MAWITRRYFVRPRPNRKTGWTVTAVIQNSETGAEDLGLSSDFTTKKEARAYADIKDEELVVEGNYRRPADGV